MHNVVKQPNIFLKSCGVHTARFLKYVWPFYNIMHERVKKWESWFSQPAFTWSKLTIEILEQGVKYVQN